MHDLIVGNWVFMLITWLPVGYITTRAVVVLAGLEIQTRGEAVNFFGAVLLGWFGLYMVVAITVVIMVGLLGVFLWLFFVLSVANWLKNSLVTLGNLFADTSWRFAPK